MPSSTTSLASSVIADLRLALAIKNGWFGVRFVLVGFVGLFIDSCSLGYVKEGSVDAVYKVK